MFSGEKLRKMRDLRGLSQEELSYRSGILVNTLWLWEKGKSDPSVSKLERIAISLNCKVDDFLDGTSSDGTKFKPKEGADQTPKFFDLFKDS